MLKVMRCAELATLPAALARYKKYCAPPHQPRSDPLYWLACHGSRRSGSGIDDGA